MTATDSTLEGTDALARQTAGGTPGTLPLNLTIAGTSGPRTDLNGLRLQGPRGGKVYLIDRGYRRHIPNPETYAKLFANWNGIITDLNVDAIPEGTPISNGAILAQGIGRGEVYLVDGGTKRYIASPAVFNKYHFNWNTIQQVPEIVLRDVPDGPTLES